MLLSNHSSSSPSIKVEAMRFDDFHSRMMDESNNAERFDNGTQLQTWLVVLVEEVGKFARSIDKLAIIPDSDTYSEERAKWKHELKYRLVTIGTTVARIDDKLPGLRARL